MYRFLVSRNGSSEIIAFFIILPLFLFPLLQGFSMFENMHDYDTLNHAARLALLQMETTGGLTPDDYQSLILYLTTQGYEEDKLTIDYTPYPVNYGEDIAVRISYNYTKTGFILSLVGLQRTEEARVMVCGPLKSVSKHYVR